MTRENRISTMNNSELFYLLRNSRALLRRCQPTPRLEAKLGELIPELEAEAERRGLVVPLPGPKRKRRHPGPSTTPPEDLLDALERSLEALR